jgi:hypothetical protein
VPNPKSKIQNPKSPGPPGLRPPQFGLRTLLLAVTLCAMLLAASQWLSAWTIAGLVLLGLSIFAHVAGNAIGTRLRELGGHPGRKEIDSPAERMRAQAQFAPVTKLGQRHTLGWPIVIATFAGLIAGGVGGGVWTLLTSRGTLELAAVGVGVISFAALGGILAFGVAGFTQVLLGAIWQAMRQSASERPRSTPQ